MSLPDISSLLSDYAAAQPNRASGGINALTGFNYQLRLYVADLAQSLASDDNSIESKGNVFFEALSDLSKQDEDFLVCIQAKRTLTTASLKDAASEIHAIDDFVASQYPLLRSKVRFRVVASRGDQSIDWSQLSPRHPGSTLIKALVQQGRLDQPVFEADPGWRAISAVWKHVKDPYGFMRFALDRSLSRINSAQDAQQIRDDICERFSLSRRTASAVGQLLTVEDFLPALHPRPNLDIGHEATLVRVRDLQYMPRPNPRDALSRKIRELDELKRSDPRASVNVFWLAGRSGAGKSVLLLQVLEQLIADGRRVVWLGGSSELFETALREVISAPEDLRPEFIAIDDLYDRDARTRIDIARLGVFIEEKGIQNWPTLLTCGPAEFADAFEEDSRYRGFKVLRETLLPVAADEAAQLAEWYRRRTGRAPVQGPAFEQALSASSGLFVSLAVELAHGDLREFSYKFAERVRVNDLENDLRLPLALNRLYLRAPYEWLTDFSREKLATLNIEGDFELLEAGEVGKVVRLTHPHLADALYRALRKPSNPEAYTNDLVAVFQKALSQTDGLLVSQLLRLFSAPRFGLAAERLSIIDERKLADECAKAWHINRNNYGWDAETYADVATSWACWDNVQPVISVTLGKQLFNNALISLDSAFRNWTGYWARLASCEKYNADLIAWASKNLVSEDLITHPRWSLVWEYCLDFGADQKKWHDLGLIWLQRHLRRADWHFVWKKFLPLAEGCQWDECPPLILALRRLKAESDGPDWAYVLQDLLHVDHGELDKTRELVLLGLDWLVGREDRSEWPFVWCALIKNTEYFPKAISVAHFLSQGRNWMQLREDRPGWTLIWQSLLKFPQYTQCEESIGNLIESGNQWLIGNESQSAWCFVFRELLEHFNNVPDQVALGYLIEYGNRCLAGREDQPEWLNIWRTMYENLDSFPEPEVLRFLDIGCGWLKGREDNQQWSFFWCELLEVAQRHGGIDFKSEILTAGHDWLAGHEDLDGWAFVWGALDKNFHILLGRMSVQDLTSVGVFWLEGNEDSSFWMLVWKALYDRAVKESEETLVESLLGLGRGWLNTHKDQASWSHVWEVLADNAFLASTSVRLKEVFTLGMCWLKGRESQADWSFIWQRLVDQSIQLKATAEFDFLLVQGVRWVSVSYDSSSWAFVCESLLEYLIDDGEFADFAAKGLALKVDDKSWSTTALKFLAVFPEYSASAEIANMLTTMIMQLPNSSRWYKNESIFAQLDAMRETRSPEIRAMCKSFYERDKAPAWSVAFELKNKKISVLGTVVAVGKLNSIVELVIGLVGAWSNVGRSVEPIGSAHNFYLHSVLPTRGILRVSTVPPEQIVTGKCYQGTVWEVRDYGILITLGMLMGLLHRSSCENFSILKAAYPVGSAISVKVVGESEKGLIFSYFGSSAESVVAGDKFWGSVRNNVVFGLFVDFESRVGLIHKSVLPAKFFTDPKFAVGQPIYVEVVEVKRDGKITLVTVG